MSSLSGAKVGFAVFLDAGDLRGRKGAYDQKDAEGFIKLNALRLRTLGQRRKTLKRD